MSNAPRMLEWFRNEPVPSITADSSIIVGGTGLLSEFLGLVSSAEGGRLAIAAPYVQQGKRSQLALWENMPHSRIELTLVTAGAGNAASALSLRHFPWKSFALQLRPRLHAKMYAFKSVAGGGACLVGSHNLTQGGQQNNYEAGVLFVSPTDNATGEIITSCYEWISKLIRGGETYFDTLHWPEGRIT